MQFARNTDIAEVSALMAAEQECCEFMTFALIVTADEVTLDVTGPTDARPIIDALAGPIAGDGAQSSTP